MKAVIALLAALLVALIVVHAVRKQSATKSVPGASGTLYYVDRHCKLHAMALPSLRPAPAPQGGGCSALVSPATPPPGWSVWPSNARLAAWCDGDRVLVSASAGEALPVIGGCAPAWRPDGSMTYVRRGAIVQFPRIGRAQELLTAAQVSATLGRSWRVDRIAWLGSDRLAVAASTPTDTELALFSGKDVVARVPVEPGIDLRASPRGTYVVTRSTRGVRIYNGRLRTIRVFAAQTAVAWSQDERWVAVGTPERLVLRRGTERVVLRFGALDLAWTR